MKRSARSLITSVFSVTIVVLAIAFLPTWVAGDETFVHKDPAFTFKYPSSYTPRSLTDPSDVLRVRDTLKGTFRIHVGDISEGNELPGAGVRYADILGSGSSGSDVKLISSEVTNLKDGTPANLYKIDWKYRTYPLKTMGIIVYKDRKWVMLNFHSFPMQWEGWGGKLEAEAKEILLSVTFK